ncbi:MAG: WD40 repeat domain-containing protein [Gemmataceae bacterium]|nr:WD40 repeat domain-containing protein [Gemmataceae bacterium]
MNQILPTGRQVRQWACAACLFLLASSPLPAQLPKLSKTLASGSIPVNLVFSPDGKTLASIGGWTDREGPSEVKLWDVTTGKNNVTLIDFAGAVWSVAFSPDGKTLASGGGSRPPEGGPGTGEVKLWDVRTGKSIVVIEERPGVVACVAFSPDGKTLASFNGDGTVRLWDVVTGRNTKTFPANGQFPGMSCISFSPDGKTMAVGGGHAKRQDGGVTGEIRLWDLATGKLTATLLGHPGHGCFSNMFAVAFSVAFSPDGKTLVSGGAQTIERWEVATGKNLATFPQPSVVWRVALHPDGKTLAWVEPWMDGPPKTPREQPIRLRDVASGKEIAALKGHQGSASCVAFSLDGRTLASGGADGKIHLWDIPATWRQE